MGTRYRAFFASHADREANRETEIKTCECDETFVDEIHITNEYPHGALTDYEKCNWCRQPDLMADAISYWAQQARESGEHDEFLRRYKQKEK